MTGVAAETVDVVALPYSVVDPERGDGPRTAPARRRRSRPAPPRPAARQRRYRHARARRVPAGPGALVLMPVTVVLGCLVVYARDPSLVLRPSFWAEDGTVWFHDAYTSGWLRPLAQPHAGYLQVFPRAIADIGLHVPLGRVPLLFATAALVVQVLPAVLMVSRRFASVAPDYRVRLLLAAIYLLVPNSSEVDANLTNAQWHLALLAVMVVLALPATGAWRVVDVVVVAVSGLTGPFSISLVIIVALLYAVRRRPWTLVLGSITLVTAVLELVVLSGARRGQFGSLGMSVDRLVELLGGRLVANTVLGTSTTVARPFVAHLLSYSVAFLVLAAVVVALALWRGPLELKLFNLYAGLVLAGSFASPLVSVTGSQWKVLIADSGARYWLLPSLAVLVDVVWLAGQVRAMWRWAAAAAVLLLVVVAVSGMREDFHYPVVAAPGWSTQVRQFEALRPGTPYTFKIRPPGWTVTVVRK